MLGLSLGWRFFIFLLSWGLGFFCLLQTLAIGRMVGPVDWAERHLGQGGTYSFVKLTGIFFIVVGIVILFKG